MSERAARLLASGFYGGYNMGDEAVLAGLRRLVEVSSRQVELTVLSGNPEHTRQAHGVRSLSRSLTRDILPRALALRRSDALLIGGGGLLQDVAGRQGIRGTLGRSLSLATWAVRARVPVVFWGIGVGPLRDTSRAKVARTLRRARIVAVRDAFSKDLCGELGVAAEIVPDHAWALDLQRRGSSGRLGVSLRRWPGLDVAAVADSLRALPERWEPPALFMPFEEPDLEIGRAVQQLVGADNLHVPDEMPTLPQLIERFQGIGALLAMRLHAGLLAAIQGIPSIGIAYDAKVSELHRCLPCGLFVPVAEAGEAVRLLSARCDAQADWSDQLLTYALQQRVLAFASARRILDGVRRDA